MTAVSPPKIANPSTVPAKLRHSMRRWYKIQAKYAKMPTPKVAPSAGRVAKRSEVAAPRPKPESQARARLLFGSDTTHKLSIAQTKQAHTIGCEKRDPAFSSM